MANTGDPRTDVHPGDVLAGKYRVECVLGAGGMGVVVAAHHLQLDQKVALKFLRPEALKSPEAVGRFVREARAAAKITGEHVARVSDVGQLENGSPYIVMEFLEGLDLSMWLKQRGPLPSELAVDFVLQTCEAIADAHAAGIVHRDLKPANLFCVQRSDGQLSIKVLDFGISKVMTPGAPGHDFTRTSALVGSPFYMSPEQMQSSKGVDSRTDIWSLGIILFELMACRTPFESESVTELAIQVALVPAPPLRAFRADAPSGLEHVIALCLEKDPARRYQTVGELAIALKDFGSKQSRTSVERVLGTLRQAGISGAALPLSGELHAATAGVVVAPNTTASWGQTSPGQSQMRSRSGGRTLVALAAAMVVVAGSVTGATLLLRMRAMTTTPPSHAAATASFIVPSTLPAVSPPAAPSQTVALPTVSSAAVVASPLPRPTAAPPSRWTAVTPGLPPAPAPAAPSCDPNFTLDDQGRKHWKPECFLK